MGRRRCDKRIKTIKITSKKLTSKTVSKNAFKGLTKATTIKVPVIKRTKLFYIKMPKLNVNMLALVFLFKDIEKMSRKLYNNRDKTRRVVL